MTAHSSEVPEQHTPLWICDNRNCMVWPICILEIWKDKHENVYTEQYAVCFEPQATRKWQQCDAQCPVPVPLTSAWKSVDKVLNEWLRCPSHFFFCLSKGSGQVTKGLIWSTTMKVCSDKNFRALRLYYILQQLYGASVSVEKITQQL